MQPLQKITLDRAEFVDQLKTAHLKTRLSSIVRTVMRAQTFSRSNWCGTE